MAKPALLHPRDGLRGIEGDIMRYKKAVRLGVFVVCLGTSAALVGAATGATGAFFSDTKSGVFTGTVGSIKIEGHGGSGHDSLDFNFDKLLPGELQNDVATFTNTGANAEDVWLVFPNVDALHAINDLGRYGEVHIKANADEVFHSKNLNDQFPKCLTPDAADLSNVCPLPRAVKLFGSVAPAGTGTFTFSFALGTLWTSQLPAPLVLPFNCYPVTSPIPTCANNGLPYQLVATQVGQLP